jgi:hypothetical protein
VPPLPADLYASASGRKMLMCFPFTAPSRGIFPHIIDSRLPDRR